MTPTYREAHPKLDVLEVQVAYFDERRVCRFTGPNFFSGEVLLLGTPGDHLVISYLFHGKGYSLVEDKARFTLDYAPTRIDPERHYFRCPACDRRKKTVYFKGGWACGECHGFRYRSQSLPGPLRVYQRNLCRRDALDAQLAEGRPHRMRNSTFARLSNERNDLEKWLSQNPRKIESPRQRLIVTHEWKRASELGEPLWSSNYVRNGNLIEPKPW